MDNARIQRGIPNKYAGPQRAGKFDREDVRNAVELGEEYSGVASLTLLIWSVQTYFSVMLVTFTRMFLCFLASEIVIFRKP
ncbi:MAG: hypothetical protein CL397_15150 [Acidiferrobacteraceae bacterium]|nr:hypothetical protein [Acidiferrobacteraceae bacterium]